jgi:hypothetical protein
LPLEIEFNVPEKSVLDLNLIESSFDLLSNPQFSISNRASWMMPTPFVLTDAVLIKEKIKASAKIVEQKPLKSRIQYAAENDSLTAVKNSIKNP